MFSSEYIDLRIWARKTLNKSIESNREETKYQGETMVTSIILIKTERTQINNVAEQLAEMEGVSEVYSVSGKYDLIVIVRVPANDDLADLVTRKMLLIDAIIDSETMLAFKAFSRHDLEAMFSVGM